jgi:DNA-directed RNA polymerase specialized sigma subunit
MEWYPNVKSQKLTLELLQKNIPIIRQSIAAQEELKSEATRSLAEKRKLSLLISEGTKAQEELLYAALPLIKSIASKEFQRRKNWGSRASYDDIIQEGIIGFLRGLQSFKVEAVNISPTNYLGQWITVSIRRKVEALDHDFNIPYEMVERHRRIRAVKARLSNMMEREPTDEELLEALNSVEQDGTIYKWGRVDKDVNKPRNKIFTEKHLEEFQELANKTYALTPYELPSEDGGETWELETFGLTDDSHGTSYENIDNESVGADRLSFFNRVFLEMQIGSRQKDIILRFFGLSPYPESQLIKEIVQETGLTAKFIKNVIDAFSMYMPQKGGVFHKVMVELEIDKVESLELSWLIPILGDWPGGETVMPPEILIQSKIGL